MRFFLALLVIAVGSMTLGTVPASAGTQHTAAVAVYAQPHSAEGGDPCAWDGTTCNLFNPHHLPVSAAYDIYLIVVMGLADPGIAALSCGIAYGPQIKMVSWTFCASGQELPNAGENGLWPASLAGNRMTWDAVADCQQTVYGGYGVHALFGSFYVYAYGTDFFGITANANLPGGPELLVGDCDYSLTSVNQKGAWVGFGDFWGCCPCDVGPCAPVDPIPTANTSWGAIKAQY